MYLFYNFNIRIKAIRLQNKFAMKWISNNLVEITNVFC